MVQAIRFFPEVGNMARVGGLPLNFSCAYRNSMNRILQARILGLIFDLDGTLTKPVIDFAEMRRRLGIGSGDMLQTVRSWPPERMREGFRIIEEIEERALLKAELQEDAPDTLRLLASRGMKLGILTRNTLRSAQKVIGMLGVSFDPVLARDFGPVKPDPAPVRFICERWGLPPRNVLLVGDYRDDIACGRAAGCATCLLLRKSNSQYSAEADLAVNRLADLLEVLP